MNAQMLLVSDVQPLTAARACQELSMWMDKPPMERFFVIWSKSGYIFTTCEPIDHMSITRHPVTRNISSYVTIGDQNVFFEDMRRIQVFRIV